MKQVNQQRIDAIRKAMQLITKKLSFSIIAQLHYGPMGFHQLRQKFHKVSITSLRETLSYLEKQKVVMRRLYTKRPIKMEYVLTKEGMEFIQVLLGIRKWSD